MIKKSPKDRFSTLTEREKDVLRMVCDHKSYQEIADELFIAKTTVKTHMHRIYVKLGLDDLNRDERILAIHNTYSAFFMENNRIEARQQENAIIEIWPDPEPLSPDEEKLVDGDEMALITFTPPTITTKGKKKMKKKEKNKRGCLKYTLVLLLGVAITIGGWQAWLYLRENPLVVSLVGLINPDLISAAQEEIPTGAGPVVTYHKTPTAKSVSQSGGAVVTYPSTPTAQSAPQTAGVAVVENNTDGIFELNEGCKQEGVWLRMMDYKITEGFIDIYLEVWNKTGQDIFFSWSSKGNFSLVDNQNNRYISSFSQTEKEQLSNNERLQLKSYGQRTLEYGSEPIYGEGVTDLYLTAEYFSRIDKAVFHIPVGK